MNAREAVKNGLAAQMLLGCTQLLDATALVAKEGAGRDVEKEKETIGASVRNNATGKTIADAQMLLAMTRLFSWYGCGRKNVSLCTTTQKRLECFQMPKIRTFTQPSGHV